MRKLHRIVLWAVLVAVAPAVSGCANFDPDSLDIFGLNEKKKLPGERRDVFPEGVPGVSQGIPKEYLRSDQQPAAGAAQSAALPPEPAKPAPAPAAVKPKPKRTVARPAQKPAATAPVAPVESQAAPAIQQEQPQQGSTGAWPAPPASGTFQR